MAELIHPDLSYKINGVLSDVHNELGQFRGEKEYGDLIESCFKKLGINYESKKIHWQRRLLSDKKIFGSIK